MDLSDFSFILGARLPWSDFAVHGVHFSPSTWLRLLPLVSQGLISLAFRFACATPVRTVGDLASPVAFSAAQVRWLLSAWCCVSSVCLQAAGGLWVPVISCSPTGAARPRSCRSFDSASRSTKTFLFSCFVFYSYSRPRNEASSLTRFSFIAAWICPGLSCCGRSRSGASPVCR
jgi:hypothetical protein